jgi:hypothetical protein
LEFLPKELDECFTNKALALKIGISVRLAQSALSQTKFSNRKLDNESKGDSVYVL